VSKRVVCPVSDGENVKKKGWPRGDSKVTRVKLSYLPELVLDRLLEG
jgi:hypothetical protein